MSEMCFPQPVTEWINRKCRGLGVPFQYLAYPLMTGVSYCLGESYVEVFKGYREPVILYSIVSGRSGTNKSGSLSKINKFMHALPKEGDEQHVYDVGSMEGLMAALKDNQGSVYCAVDELKSFLDLMDKNGGHAERCRYLSLWSGLDWSKRTKGTGICEITNPRFNFTSFNQNYFLIDLLLNSAHYDGFLPRFLVATPDEVFVGLDEKMKASKEREQINMRRIIRQIYKYFRSGCIFVFDEKALNKFKQYDQEVLDERKSDRFDDMKSMVLAKSVNNLIRVSAVQCALRSAVMENFSNIKPHHVHNVTTEESEETEEAGDDIPSTYTVQDDLDDDDESSDDEESDDSGETDRKTVTITESDVTNAMTIVKYSTACIMTLVNSTKVAKKGKKRQASSSSMPDSVDMMDLEFCKLQRMKIQKLFQLRGDPNNSDLNNPLKVKVSSVTRNHIYPQSSKFCENESGSVKGKMFLMGLEKFRLGKLCDNSQYFELLDVEQEENIPNDVLQLLIDLGLIKNKK